MRRCVLLLSSLVACGTRTGLLEEQAASDAQVDAGTDGGTDAEMDADARPDAHESACPLFPPIAGTACPVTESSTLCAYVSSLGPDHGPLVEWFCIGGGWVNDTCKSCRTETCPQINCTPGNTVECIVGNGKERCLCSSPTGNADQCGPF